MDLGTLEEAQLIYRRRKSGAGPLPAGWRKLGEGISRQAYLSPTGTVYKIMGRQDNSNENEYLSCQKIKEGVKNNMTPLPKPWRVAECKLYKWDGLVKKPRDYFTYDWTEGEVCVIAMEYIDGQHAPDNDYWSDQGDVVFSHLGSGDGHVANWVMSNKGEYVIIDLGEGLDDFDHLE